MHEFVITTRPAQLDGGQLWLLFHQGRLLVSRDPHAPLPEERIHRFLSDEPLVELYLGRLGERHCLAVALPDEVVPPAELDALDLRQLLGILDDAHFSAASRGMQLVTWYRNHRYCSRCGAATSLHPRDPASVCQRCDYTQYPRITPCVIMLVRRGDQALLARSARFRLPMFSCLAGFMEAGETAEQAVHREVLEETGLRIRNLRYHGSQSWPFPHSLMLAFTAEYLDGDLRLEDEELVEADWFSADALPMIPPQGSIARTLIESWLDDVRHREGRD